MSCLVSFARQYVQDVVVSRMFFFILFAVIVDGLTEIG